jgi:hypothetical protein
MIAHKRDYGGKAGARVGLPEEVTRVVIATVHKRASRKDS